MDHLLQDIRYALRALRRAPGFSVAAILSLALGIGANTAIFTVFNAALLRPLNVESPEQLVQIKTDRVGNVNPNFSYPHYEALRDSRVFEGVVARSPMDAALRIENATEQVSGAGVSADYFSVLGLRSVRARS